MEIGTLFEEEGQTARDIVKYADIALELEEYGFAAQLFYFVLSYLEPEDYENRNVLEYFLYCLEKLGVEDIKENFKGDHEARFAELEKRIEDAGLFQGKKDGE